jgi:YaiO family outer membrane protein
MEQVRAQRAASGAAGGAGMTRAISKARSLALAALMLGSAAATATAQGVRQQAAARPRYDVDSAVARATQLRRQNRKAEAERVLAKAMAEAPNRADVRALHEQLRQEVSGGEAMLGADVKSWREQLPEWREGMVSARQNTAAGPVVARLSRVARGPLSDERFQLEAYPAFPHGYLALAGGLATSATVYAHTSASAEVYGSLTEQVEASVGYRHMQFDSGVDMIGGSLGTYVGSFLLGARGSHVLRDGGSSLVLSARRFMGDEGAYVGAKLATGSVPVELRTPTDFAVRFNQAAALEGKAYVLRRLVLWAEGELGREGLLAGGSSEYSAVRVGVGVRY